MPKYRVKAPDGATYDVDAPNEQALQEAISVMFGNGQSPQQDKVSSRGLTDVVAGNQPIEQPPATNSEIGKSLVADTLAGVAGLPGTLFNLGREYIPGMASVTGQAPDIASMRSMLTDTGIKEARPQSNLGKMAYSGAVGALTSLPLGPAGLAMMAPRAGLGAVSGAGSEAGGQIFEGTSSEGPARLIGGLVAPGVASLGMSGANAAKNTALGAFGKQPIQPQLNEIVANSLKSEGTTAQSALGKIANAKGAKSLADISPQLASEAVVAARQTPIAAKAAQTLSGANVEKSLDRIRGAIKNYVSAADDNIVNAKQDLFANMKAQAKPYSDAFEQMRKVGITETAPKQAIRKLATRFPEVFDKAVKYGNQARGEVFPDSLNKLKIGDIDNTIAAIDDVLYGTNDIAKSFQGKTGALNSTGKALSEIRQDLSSFLKKRSPDYAAKQSIFSNDIRMAHAMEEGAKFMRGDIDKLSQKFANYTPGEREALKSGFARGLRDKVQNLGRENDTTMKTIDKLQPFLGSSFNKFKAVMLNEQKIQQTQRNFRRVLPDAAGIQPSNGGQIATDIVNASVSPKTGALGIISRNFDKFVKGRGPEYYKKLNEALTEAVLSTDPAKTSKLLSAIIREQRGAVEAANALKAARPAQAAAIATNVGTNNLTQKNR